jgi:hypothetical protein
LRNKKVEKVKADVKKGMDEVGKAAANLKDDVKADVEWLKANLEHNADAEKKAVANAYIERTRDNVESIFGGNAGIVWKALNLNGPMTIDDLMKATNLNIEEIFGALGWLGRENTISLETREKVRSFSLR